MDCPIPCLGLGTICFFGLGCFVVAVGMGRVRFLAAGYVGMGGMGWEEC
jgi:hypothetical protein